VSQNNTNPVLTVLCRITQTHTHTHTRVYMYQSFVEYLATKDHYFVLCL